MKLVRHAIPGRGAALVLGLIAAPIIFLAALRMRSTDSLPGRPRASQR
jgi:hypothetical protein